MKQLITILVIALIAISSNAQNVGVGTTTPIEKLDVNGNVNVGGTIKANGVAGSSGQILSTTGSGLAWVNGIYTINSTNYSSTTIPANNYVRIDGTITLSSDYSGLNSSKLIIEGGGITGNGTTILYLNNYSTVSGTNFNNVDISGNNLTFINCSFSGTCPRLGFASTFINCQISGVTTTYTNLVGLMDNCSLQNSTMPRVSDFRNCNIVNCTFGSGIVNQCALSSLTNCLINTTSIYSLQSNLTFTNNEVSNSKLYIGNSTQSPSEVTIANNKFSGLLSGTSEVIEVSPLCTYYKMFIIQGNIFTMQSSDYSSIKITGTEGNPYGYSSTTIQNNVFHRGTNTLNYSGNMKVNFSNNTSISAGGTGSVPGVSGNLQVTNNITL